MAGQTGARLETALQTLHEGLSRQGTTHPGVHGLRTNSVGWDAERLGVDASPGGVRKLVVQPRRRRENARNAVPHA